MGIDIILQPSGERGLYYKMINSRVPVHEQFRYMKSESNTK